MASKPVSIQPWIKVGMSSAMAGLANVSAAAIQNLYGSNLIQSQRVKTFQVVANAGGERAQRLIGDRVATPFLACENIFALRLKIQA
jgi:hypothetical protein